MGEEMATEFCLQSISCACRVLLHAINLRHGTSDFTSHLKEVMLWIFTTLKNPSSLARFELMNLGSNG
jgi:hypothetical protein